MKAIKNRLKIRSKNHSAKLLDRFECDKLSVLRLGSKTPNDVVFANSKRYKKGEIPFEINTVEPINASVSLLFTAGKILRNDTLPTALFSSDTSGKRLLLVP